MWLTCCFDNCRKTHFKLRAVVISNSKKVIVKDPSRFPRSDETWSRSVELVWNAEKWWLNIAKVSKFWIGWPRCSCRVFRVRFSPATWNRDVGERFRGVGLRESREKWEAESWAGLWPTFWNCVVSFNQLASKANYSSSSRRNGMRRNS